MIKNFRLLLFLILAMGAVPAQALIVPERPTDGFFITDTMNVINEVDKNTIRNTILKLKRELGIPIILVTINSILHYTEEEYLGIERYSKKLFNYWRIGHASHNYGVLLIVSVEDKVARIQFGGGWGFLYDEQAQKIMDDFIIPYFKKGQYSVGIKTGVIELDKLARTKLYFLVSKTKLASILLLFVMVTAFLMVVSDKPCK